MPSSKLADAFGMHRRKGNSGGHSMRASDVSWTRRAAPFGGSFVWPLVRDTRSRFRGSPYTISALGVVFVQCRVLTSGERITFWVYGIRVRKVPITGLYLRTSKSVYPVKRGFVWKRFEFRRVRVTAAVGWCPPVSARPFKHSTPPLSQKRRHNDRRRRHGRGCFFFLAYISPLLLFFPSFLFSIDTSFS